MKYDEAATEAARVTAVSGGRVWAEPRQNPLGMWYVATSFSAPIEGVEQSPETLAWFKERFQTREFWENDVPDIARQVAGHNEPATD